MTYPKVSIIILNWNGLKDTIKCLESLKKITYPNYEVIVVDNGSEGNDADILEEQYKDYIRVIRNKENLGFAGGNNVGIRKVLEEGKSEYILLLNNDTIVDPSFLDELVKVATQDEKIGSVQSLLLNLNKKTIDSLGQELLLWGATDKGIYSDKSLYNLEENQEIFGACAASVLYKTEVIKQTGFFDEKFFAIFEDVDLSWKIRLIGYKSFLAVKSLVYHKRGISGKSSSSNFKKYLFHKNLLSIIFRYYPQSLILFFIRRYPYKFLRSFSGAIIYSFKIEGINGFLNLFISFKKDLIVRKKYKHNQYLKLTQDKWIKKKIS